jgi:hypothetical protein
MADSARSQKVLVASIAVGAIFGLINGIAAPSGWLWTALWALDGVVFVVALALWLASRLSTRQHT